MADIEFRIGGRKVSLSEFRNGIEAMMAESIVNTVQSKIGQLECPDHKEKPRVIASGQSLGSLKFSVEGCCERVSQLVEEALK